MRKKAQIQPRSKSIKYRLQRVINKIRNKIAGRKFEGSITPIRTKSSNVRKWGYDPKTQTLEIHFKNKGNKQSVYRYANVPKNVHKQIQSVHESVMKGKKKNKYGTSFGTYFHKNVRGKYPYERIN